MQPIRSAGPACPGVIGLAGLASTRLGFVLAAGLAFAAPALASDITCLSDEFDDPATLSRWSRVHTAEQFPADQLAVWDIDATQPGRMVMTPHTCTWYRDYRGPMAFQLADGDFVFTAQVTVSSRTGPGVPQSDFSLAGIMLRTPREITPVTWTSGGENYVFLSLGHGMTTPAQWECEVKTTIGGDSVLSLSPAPGPTVTLQLARIGDAVIALRQAPGGSWVVHQRYARSDFPGTLQVGLVTYTDWNKAGTFDPFVHNMNVLNPPLPTGVFDPSPGQPYFPDLVAGFEYARFNRPVVPAALAGLDLTDPSQVPDAWLLDFLGDAANRAGLAVDLNGDGLVDFADYLEFLNLYEVQDARVDFNRDGLVDFLDYLEFLNLFDGGC